MSRDGAQRAVTISALIVAAVYAYRRFTSSGTTPVQKGSLKNVIGLGDPVPLAQWATAWGFTFLVIAVIAEADPSLGGSFAILVATGDVLANTPAITSAVNKQTGASSTAVTPPSTLEPLQPLQLGLDPLQPLQPPYTTPVNHG